MRSSDRFAANFFKERTQSMELHYEVKADKADGNVYTEKEIEQFKKLTSLFKQINAVFDELLLEE